MNKTPQETEYEKVYQPILTKTDAHYIVCERVKKYLSGVPTAELHSIKRALKNILISKIVDDQRSINELVNHYMDLASKKPFVEGLKDMFYANNYVEILLAFVATGRSDVRTYKPIFNDSDTWFAYRNFGKLVCVPYVYSPLELPFLKETLDALDKKKIDVEPADVYLLISIIRRQARKDNEEPDTSNGPVVIMNNKITPTNIDMLLRRERDDKRDLKAIMSLRPKPTVHVDPSSLLTPAQYVRMIYDRTGMNFDTGMEAETMQTTVTTNALGMPKGTKSKYDGLYVEYNTPNDLKILFPQCQSYLVFVGETHKLTHVQPYGFDPRFGFGEVPLPFKVALVTEQQIPQPRHLRSLSYTWKIKPTIQKIMNQLRTIDMDRNKLQILLQLKENKPLTGYAPKIRMNQVLNNNASSNNFDAIRLLYKDMDELTDEVRETSWFIKDSKQIYDDIKSIIRYLF